MAHERSGRNPAASSDGNLGRQAAVKTCEGRCEMKALVFDERLSFRANYPAPTPAPAELLVQVRRAGICRTDIEITKGYMNYRGVLGHEFVGVLADGSRVV